MIALHGNYDRPEWQCETWRSITGGEAFVLCPRGSPVRDSPPSDRRYTFDSLAALERELDAAMKAFDAAHPARAPRPVVLAGFSLGGVFAAHLASRKKAPYERLVLVEGGDRVWSPGAASRFVRRGGRMVVACTQPWCRHRFGRIRPWFGQAMKLVTVDGVGHTYGGPVASALAAQWPFVTPSKAMPKEPPRDASDPQPLRNSKRTPTPPAR